MKRSEHRGDRSFREPASGSGGEQTGSSEPEFLIVGQIVRPHGVRGEVGMKLLTAYPERLPAIETLYLGEAYQPYQVSRMRRHSEGMLIQFRGVNDRNDADVLRGLMVHIHIDNAVPLEDGEYYLFQIEGIRVVTDAGDELGRLTGLLETGANDVYVVTTPEGREVLLPAIPDVIRNVDVSAQIMTVHLIDGLI